jgi:hypothetical protein
MEKLSTIPNEGIDWSLVKDKYLSVLQHQALLADTKNMIGEVGRAGGKTTHIFTPRIMRVSYDLKKAIIMFAGPTYTMLMDTIVPEITGYLNTHYTRGLHFEYGKRPPAHFHRPYTEITRWEHTISFPWGTVIQFGSMDRPESFIGKNVAHIIADELLRIKEVEFRERALPSLRGDRELYGNSPYFKGISGFSSTPNMETDQDWFLEYEKLMDPEVIEEIQYVAYRIALAGGIIMKMQKEILELEKFGKFTKIDVRKNEIERCNRFISRWDNRLRQRKLEKDAWWYYLKGTSFSNLAYLGLDYMQQQLMGTGDHHEKFNLSILGIRPQSVKNRFFAKFSVKHELKDSYKYEHAWGPRISINSYSIDQPFNKNSLDLRHCDPDKPLYIGFDPGYFMSCVVGQRELIGNTETLKVFKDFYVITPDQHYELAHQIDAFFVRHQMRTIYLYPDRAGHQHKQKYLNNPKGKTDVAILKKELQDLKWNVHIEGVTRTIEYWEHFFLWDRLLGEREPQLPKLRFCPYETEATISSIRFSPAKKTDTGMIELDKTAEKKLDYRDQAFYAPQLASSAMYLVFGLYYNLKPESMPDSVDIPGL